MRRAPIASAAWLVATGLLATACNPPGGSTLGMRQQSGLVRLDESSFGLLIYPCWDGALVSEVVLAEVVVTEPGVVESSRVILRERYPEPVHPRDLVVSTDLEADGATASATREIVDVELLDRFNNDGNYLTAIDADHFLMVEALSRADPTSAAGEILVIGSRSSPARCREWTWTQSASGRFVARTVTSPRGT